MGISESLKLSPVKADASSFLVSSEQISKCVDLSFIVLLKILKPCPLDPGPSEAGCLELSCTDCSVCLHYQSCKIHSLVTHVFLRVHDLGIAFW